MRRGFTLVELLVVIVIIVLLAVLAVRAFPDRESRAVREAARSVHTFVGKARSEAMASGKSTAVVFQRLYPPTQGCAILLGAKAPPPYAGDTTAATVRMQFAGMLADGRTGYIAIPQGGYTASLVSLGDLFQVNSQGPLYEVLSPDGIALAIDRPPGSLPWTGTPSDPLPYKIIRRPRPGSDVLKLPPGTAVDLRWSGGTSVLPMDAFRPGDDSDIEPIVVEFNASGSVTHVYCRDQTGNYRRQPAMEPLHFLIGELDRIPVNLNAPSPAEDGLSNWQMPASNFWVSLFPLNGAIKVSEVSTGGTLLDTRQYTLSPRSATAR